MLNTGAQIHPVPLNADPNIVGKRLGILLYLSYLSNNTNGSNRKYIEKYFQRILSATSEEFAEADEIRARAILGPNL